MICKSLDPEDNRIIPYNILLITRNKDLPNNNANNNSYAENVNNKLWCKNTKFNCD